MTQVELVSIRIDRVLEIVHELRQEGLVQGQDFDFAYSPERLNYNLAYIGEVLDQRHTVFSFYNDSLASWFALKYVPTK